MMTKQNDAATMAEGQLDAVVAGIILNNDEGRGDRFRPTGSRALQHVALPKACVPGSEPFVCRVVQPLTAWA